MKGSKSMYRESQRRFAQQAAVSKSAVVFRFINIVTEHIKCNSRDYFLFVIVFDIAMVSDFTRIIVVVVVASFIVIVMLCYCCPFLRSCCHYHFLSSLLIMP